MDKLKKLLRILANDAYRSSLTRGAAAGVEHLQVLRSLACDLVVDVGANRGQFALAARSAFPEARIVAFEPLEEPAVIFRRVFAVDPLVTLYPFALGDAEAEMVMHVSAAEDSSSLLPIGAAQTEHFPGTGEREQRAVQVAPLSRFIRSSEIPTGALLKIDVQGYELAVLRGCANLIQSFSYVYVECSFLELYQGQALAHQVIAWLAEKGFDLAGVYNLCYNRQGVALQGDFLFVNRSR